jgi:hypothetical protein
MNVSATKLIRKMRGGAQAHLLECDDGHWYVVKFRNNPQHRRILINEWIASALLNYLHISTPITAIVSLSTECLQANPEICIEMRSRHQPVETGRHFGSRYPGNPSKVMAYDFLPDTLLDKVINANELLGVLAFDKWTGNADARQCIFYRARLPWPSPVERHSPRAGFMAHMIDHGCVFNGPHWTFPDSPLQGLYFRPNIYQGVRGLEDFQPWLDRVEHFPEGVLDQARRQIPPEWMLGDELALDALLKKLMSRCKRVPYLIENSLAGRANPFPQWIDSHAVSE